MFLNLIMRSKVLSYVNLPALDSSAVFQYVNPIMPICFPPTETMSYFLYLSFMIGSLVSSILQLRTGKLASSRNGSNPDGFRLNS